MDLSQRLSISYYKTVSAINEEHKIYLVQHQETQKFFVKKILDVYSIDIYKELMDKSVPGIPKIFALYEENNTLTLIEEFISGNTLREIIETGHLSREQICKYLIEICNVLEKLHLHKPPLVHRDIKPSNIMISNHEDVYLLDFNAAKYSSGDANKKTDTVLLGTQGYAAPEQYGFGESSPLTDIYSIGIVLKEAASSANVDDLAFDTIINKCTQIDPLKRYSSVKLLKKDLIKTLDGKMITPRSEEVVNKYFPPGFRTLKVWKMMISLPIYAFVAFISLTLRTVDDTYTTGSVWSARLFMFLILISNVLIAGNYLGIQNHSPLNKSRNVLVRILGVLIQMILVTISWIIVLLFVSGIVSNIK